MYAVTLDLGGLKVTASGDTIDEMMNHFKQMGGDPDLLAAALKDEAPNWQPHPQNVFVAGGELDRREPDLDAAEAVVRNRMSDAEPAPDVEPADPWRRGSTRSPQSDSADSDQVDPWSGKPTSQKAAAATTGSRRGTSGPPASDDAAGVWTKKDKWDNAWTFGLPEAPNCFCGDPAARKKGVSGPNSRKPGTPYTVYQCAKAGPDGDWRDKCDFSEFPSNR